MNEGPSSHDYTQTNRLTTSQLQASYTLFPQLNSNIKILAQGNVFHKDAHFNFYIFENEIKERSLLVQPLVVKKKDDQTISCSIKKFIRLKRKIFTNIEFKQTLIPIAEVGGYPLSSIPSRHFILAVVDDKDQAIVYDSNPSYHVRTTRDQDLVSIFQACKINYLRTSYLVFNAPNRGHLSTQPLFDNRSCGYFSFHFILLLLAKPNDQLDYNKVYEKYMESVTAFNQWFYDTPNRKHELNFAFDFDQSKSENNKSFSVMTHSEESPDQFTPTIAEMLKKWFDNETLDGEQILNLYLKKDYDPKPKCEDPGISEGEVYDEDWEMMRPPSPR